MGSIKENHPMTLNKDGLEAVKDALWDGGNGIPFNKVDRYAKAAITAYLAALPAPDGLVERLREEIGGLRDVLAERDQCLDELEAEHGMPWRFWSKKAQDLATKLEAAEQQVRDMRAGLEFYRDGFKFTTNPRYGGLEWKPTEALLDDCGNIARLLLKEGGE